MNWNQRMFKGFLKTINRGTLQIKLFCRISLQLHALICLISIKVFPHAQSAKILYKYLKLRKKEHLKLINTYNFTNTN